MLHDAIEGKADLTFGWVSAAIEPCLVVHRDRYRPSFPMPLVPAKLLRVTDQLLHMEAAWVHVAERADWGCYPCP